MGKSLAEVDEMTCEEFDSWRAYFDVEPWGTHAVEVLIARLSQVICASSGVEPRPTKEYMPFYKSVEDRMAEPIKDPELMIAKMRAGGLEILRNG